MVNINGLNIFFNMIYNNTHAFLRALKDEKQLNAFKSCLDEYHIDNLYLHNIDYNAVQLYSSSSSLEEVEAITHVPLHVDIEKISDTYKDHAHIIIINNNTSNYQFNTHYYKGYYLYTSQVDLNLEMSVFDPYIQFLSVLLNMDRLPGILVMNGDYTNFIPIENQDTIPTLLHHIDMHDDLYSTYSRESTDKYFIQISDLHIGTEANNNGLNTLIESIDTIMPMIPSAYSTDFLITGDLMDSPKVKNMHLSRDFMNFLKKQYQADVTFVLGNHDVIVHGFNFNRTQKSKVIANLLQESIKVLEKEKIILIKMDTNIEGNLARGKVGQRQLKEIDDELSAIHHIEDYTIIVLMHHHLYAIEKSEFVKKKWHENINLLDKLVDNSKALIDAEELIEWLKAHEISYVLHGHKHVPNFKKADQQYYIGAGKATGGLKEKKSKYISYNILKYSTKEKKMKLCLILYYDKQEYNRLRIELNLFDGGN